MTRRPPTPSDFIHDPRLNKGTAFTEAERDALGLRGLYPPRVSSQAEQTHRILKAFRAKPDALERYIYLLSLQDRNEHLFYRTLIDHIEEMTPVIYTPTVGEACRKFGHIFRRPRGLYLTAHDRGRVEQILRNWLEPDVGIIVVTDGERILGLGDLGANGMGIPIGKLSLYTACAGIDPVLCLPITIDVGTENEELLADPLYLGLAQRRLRGPAYDELIDEFVMAVQKVFPGAVIQFEDFATDQAVRLLARYRDRVCCFNDDIQGTAAVTLAGILTARRVSGRPLAEQRVLFLGAGSAATGIADLIAYALAQEGMSLDEARRHCWLVDRSGLVVAGRGRLAAHKVPYAHPHQGAADLLAAIEAVKPTALVGVSTTPGAFSEAVVRRMAELNERPIIFPLSNPTSHSECSAEQAYGWSEGRAVFLSGSPFPPVSLGGRTFVPGQGNNAYIFPGIGLGLVVAGARRVTDAMFLAAARALDDMVTDDALAEGRLVPRLRDIRSVSARIAAAVAEIAWAEGIASAPRPADLPAAIGARMYDGSYPDYA